MEFVKVRGSETLQTLGATAAILLLLFVMVGLPIIAIRGEEASLDSYRRVSAMSEELPELRGEISRYKEDGVLTRAEVSALVRKADRIRKGKELEKIK